MLWLIPTKFIPDPGAVFVELVLGFALPPPGQPDVCCRIMHPVLVPVSAFPAALTPLWCSGLLLVMCCFFGGGKDLFVLP